MGRCFPSFLEGMNQERMKISLRNSIDRDIGPPNKSRDIFDNRSDFQPIKMLVTGTHLIKPHLTTPKLSDAFERALVVFVVAGIGFKFVLALRESAFPGSIVVMIFDGQAPNMVAVVAIWFVPCVDSKITWNCELFRRHSAIKVTSFKKLNHKVRSMTEGRLRQSRLVMPDGRGTLGVPGAEIHSGADNLTNDTVY
jgi:hypothetical protein